jgi:autotransporter-associated beta strand protein
LAVVLAVVGNSHAQVTSFSITSLSGSTTSVNGTATGLSETPVLSRTGLNVASGTAVFSSTQNLITQTSPDFSLKYVGFAASPSAGNVLFATGLSFGVSGSSTAPNQFGAAFSTDNFATSNSTTGSVTTSAVAQSFNFNLITNDTLSVRIQNFGTTSLGGALGTGGSFRITANVTLNGNTLDASTGAIALTGATEIRNSGALALGGNISGAQPITKTGSGTLTLNGTNTYTGSTTVSAGTLALGSAGLIASSSVLKIASGATFDVKAKSGGFTLNNPLTIDVDVANAGKLDATGVALTYGGNLTLNITTATPLSSYNLFVFSSELGTFSSIALTGSFSGNMTNSSGVWTASSNGYDFTFTESNGVLSAATAAIPEPGSWVLVGIAAIFFLYRIRRKDASSSEHN